MPLEYDQHVRLYDRWAEWRGGRPMPERVDLNPSKFGNLLPHLSLIETVENRFRYRLMGRHLIDDLRHDYTRSFVGEHSKADYAEALLRLLADVRDRRQPVFATARYHLHARVRRATSRLFLPFGPNLGAVDLILVSRVALSGAAWARVDWENALASMIDGIHFITGRDDLAVRCRAWEVAVVRAPPDSAQLS
jgi:hypothetical protein